MDFALSYKSMRNFLAKNSIKIVSQAPYASDFALPVTFPFSQIQITTSRFEFVRDWKRKFDERAECHIFLWKVLMNG